MHFYILKILFRFDVYPLVTRDFIEVYTLYLVLFNFKVQKYNSLINVKYQSTVMI